MSHSAASERIVITGMGIVSPLGCGVETVWQRLTAGQSGIRGLSDEMSAGTGISVGGSVPTVDEDPLAGYDPEAFILPKERKKNVPLYRVCAAGGGRSAEAGGLASSAGR
ncbi:hypothetical protein CBI35_20910 [Pantoea sp. AV62]|nr:hypothetical protein CBI35_20910 [Pantoea sp. AV62]